MHQIDDRELTHANHKAREDLNYQQEASIFREANSKTKYLAFRDPTVFIIRQ